MGNVVDASSFVSLCYTLYHDWRQPDERFGHAENFCQRVFRWIARIMINLIWLFRLERFEWEICWTNKWNIFRSFDVLKTWNLICWMLLQANINYCVRFHENLLRFYGFLMTGGIFDCIWFFTRFESVQLLTSKHKKKFLVIVFGIFEKFSVDQKNLIISFGR